LWSLDAAHPLLAGLAIGLGYMTRAPLLFAFPLFVIEAARICMPSEVRFELPAESSWRRAWRAAKTLDKGRFLRLLLMFALPIAVILVLSLWHNRLRFGDPFEVGYRYLSVAWRDRMLKWGLFHYHYLARNLGVVLTSLPYWPEPGRGDVMQINAHGLALWLTTPAYLWLLWPRKVSSLSWALGLTALCVAVPSLFYQNTGWLQFGYRFSNDYAVFLIALLAIGGFRFRVLFYSAFVWAVAVNAFGAITFGRSKFDRFYYQDASQRTLHQTD
jgi:hypothetical protein